MTTAEQNLAATLQHLAAARAAAARRQARQPLDEMAVRMAQTEGVWDSIRNQVASVGR